MPKYDYCCSGCQYVYEIEHGSDEKPIVLCNECGHRCRKMITVMPVLYKTSGFYTTDKRDKNDS